jgi:ABC-type transport system involved in multi-copper enzyme maturation permease subunit
MRALVRKELREVFGIAAAALGCYLALVASLMGAKVFDWVPGMPHGTTEVPFVGNEFTLLFLLVSVVFAVALGFRQSAWESSQGTYLFLLHRPLARGRIFLVKLLTGGGLLLACSALPIGLYGGWAATPGTHPGPFEWSMAGPAVQFALLMPLLYLGAFLSGLRPGRWFGTRLFPLVASVVFLAALWNLPWWALGLPLAVVTAAGMGVAILHVAAVRDYA